MTRPVVVARFDFPHEAGIAKNLLESRGLTAFVSEEHTINASWLYARALGEVKVLVPPSQAQEARELLAQDFSEDVEAEWGREEIVCPHCGSENNKVHMRGRWPAWVMFFFVGFPLAPFRHGWKCQDCGEFWRMNEK